MESKDPVMDPWGTHVLLFSSFTKNSDRKNSRIVLCLHTLNTCRTDKLPSDWGVSCCFIPFRRCYYTNVVEEGELLYDQAKCAMKGKLIQVVSQGGRKGQ